MDLLRVFTCGSVDDGKSTLIGRLLYDTKSVFREHLDYLAAKERVGDGELNLALLTDGLKAEREQGITIDVAYKYFATPKRKFILADTPGHVQYTRNMVTGASLADVAVILIDARHGILEQTRRHCFIAHLLRVPHLIVCVNKMDLVGYSADRFAEIEQDFLAMANTMSFLQKTLIPIAALKGDNIVHRSEKMPWYSGQPLLEVLEQCPAQQRRAEGTRYTVQCVLRPQTNDLHDFRGYAGILRSGTLRVGQKIRIETSGAEATIRALHYSLSPAEEIYADDAAVVELDCDLDIGRGDIFTDAAENPPKGTLFRVFLTHLDTAPLKMGIPYYLLTGTRKVKCLVKSVEKKLNLHTLTFEPDQSSVGLNEIAEVILKTAQPVLLDRYAENWTTGAGVLVDSQTNMTSAAIMNEEVLA
ncbi:MAG: GTP-binding protein [Leptospiraceae bacterium]|nr:GTP-binding protein [Leptospiraceae bacterium]